MRRVTTSDGRAPPAGTVLATSIYVWLWHQDRPELARPATLIVFLVIIQVTLGALTVTSAPTTT